MFKVEVLRMTSDEDGSVEIRPILSEPPFVPDRFQKLRSEYDAESGLICLEGLRVYALVYHPKGDPGFSPGDVLEVSTADLFWSVRTVVDDGPVFSPWGAVGDKDRMMTILFDE